MNDNEIGDFSVDEMPQDEDSQAILNAMKEEGEMPETPKEEDSSQEDETTEEESEEVSEEESEESKDEEEAEEATEESKEEAPKKVSRKAKMVESWQVGAAKRQAAKEAEAKYASDVQALKEQIESLKNQSPKPEETANTVDVSEKIKELASKKGVDEELLTELVKITSAKQLPTEVTEAMKELNEIKKQRQAEKEDLEFNKEFGAILSDIKAEYPEATKGELAKIRQKLYGHAFSEAYSTTPVKLIYRGLDEFRNTPVVKKKTAETSITGKEGKPAGGKDFASWTEEDVASASEKEFEEYSKWTDEQGKQ